MWEEATDPAVLLASGHVIKLGQQVHAKDVLGGTPDAGRHIGYLAKYLTKSVSAKVGLDEDASARKREHARRLHPEPPNGHLRVRRGDLMDWLELLRDAPATDGRRDDRNHLSRERLGSLLRQEPATQVRRAVETAGKAH